METRHTARIERSPPLRIIEGRSAPQGQIEIPVTFSNPADPALRITVPYFLDTRATTCVLGADASHLIGTLDTLMAMTLVVLNEFLPTQEDVNEAMKSLGPPEDWKGPIDLGYL
eukprot:m51a1_g3310 hypothetical protein (114) ;mRNA; r:333703-334365